MAGPVAISLNRPTPKGFGQPPDGTRHKRGPGNGQDPGPEDASRNAPAYRAQPLQRADPDDCPGDRVGGADGDPLDARRSRQGKSRRRLGAKTVNGAELDDPLAHGFYDSPAAEHGAQAHGKVARQNDLSWHARRRRLVDRGRLHDRSCMDTRGAYRGNGRFRAVRRLEQAGAEKQHEDDPHGLLGVVATMPQTEKGRREQLTTAKDAVHPARRGMAQEPGDEQGDETPQKPTDDGSEGNEHDDVAE